MKKLTVLLAGLMVAFVAMSQIVEGSIQRGSAPNKVDIVYRPDHNSSVGEYVQALSISIAIPTSIAAGVVPTITSAGPFSPALSFSQASPFSYPVPADNETVFSWICTNNTAFTMSWTTGNAFVGATITFNGGNVPTMVKLVDRSNLGGGGGDNFNTFFGISVNVAPFTLNSPGLFYAISDPGGNGSILGTYSNGDVSVQTQALITLPVHMLNFSGYKNSGKNTLNWTVANETNNKGFDVLRSTDGANYSSIGFVNSQVGGNSSSEVHYTFDDNNPGGKKQYYRLSQKDFDGNGRLSNIIMISRDRPTVLGIGGIFPNPANAMVNVMIDAPQRDYVTLMITDMGGKTVKQQQANVDVGSNTVPVDIAKLAAGSYLVKLVCQSSDCNAAAAKFNKQ